VITEEMNISMEEELTKVEVLVTLSCMQKGNIPCLDGFSIEFFIIFYNLIKEVLLKVVKESQTSGNVKGSFNSTFIALIHKT
jgi:hypothetical protein